MKVLDITNEIRLYVLSWGLGLEGVKTTEAGGRRKLSHNGVLPIVAGGVWPGRCDLHCDMTGSSPKSHITDGVITPVDPSCLLPGRDTTDVILNRTKYNYFYSHNV
jgi:hypothetical protein